MRLFAVLVLAVSASSAHASRLAVAPLRGKGGEECARALATTFAEQFEIVELEGSIEELSSWEQLSDWIGRHGGSDADVILVGSLGNKSIILEAYSAEDKKLIGLRSVPTKARCQLSPKEERALVVWIARTLGEPEPEPIESPEEETDPGDEPPPIAEGEPPLKKKAPAPVAAPIVTAASASIGIGRRGLTFLGFEGSRVRNHSVDAMPVVQLSFEVFPIPKAEGWTEIFAPLGVGISFGHSIAVTSKLIDGGPNHGTVHTEVEAAVLYRYQLPFESINAILIPRIGYHHFGVSLSGARELGEPDIPNVAYSSVSFGIGAEAPVYERIDVFGRGSYLLLLDAGQIFDDHFFPDGSGRGYEIMIGMSYRVIEGFAIEIVGQHVSYSLTLDPAGVPGVADSASDTVSSIGIGASLSF